MNNYSFALDSPCFLVHSAHYSKNWDKKKQDEYNAKYYQEHKDKWGVDGGYSETDKEIKYTGQIGDYAADDLKKLEKDHGELGDDNWLGEGGDVSLSTTKDGTKVLLNGDSIVASGKDLDGVDMKVLSKYLTDIYAQAGDHAAEKGFKTGTKEHAAFWKEFNAKVNDQLKGLIAKQKQAKHDDFTDFLGMSSYLSHHGILGQKWGITLGPPYPLTGSAKKEAIKRKTKYEKRYMNSDGTLNEEGIHRLKDTTTYVDYTHLESRKKAKDRAGIKEGKKYDVLPKGTKVGRIANSGEPIDSKRKYVYVTDDDKMFRYGTDWEMLPLDFSKPISEYEYTTKKDLRVKHGDEIVKDIVNKYGDASIKQLYDNDLLNKGLVFNNLEKLNKKEKEFIKGQGIKSNNFVKNVMKNHMNDLLSDYKKQGYDAIVDPEDYTWADYPVILIDPKSSIKLKEEIKWDEKYA